MADKLIDKIQLYREIKAALSPFELDNWQRNFAVEYTHNSTAIEGNTLTLIQTKLVIEDGISPSEVPLKDVKEVDAHNNAFKFIQEQVLANRIIDEDFIKDVHERVCPQPGFGGLYRNVPVYIVGASHTPPATAKEVWEGMKFFIADLREKEKSGIDPIEKAAWIHAEVVKIHPFPDGNGRTCRLLMNYSLMQDNYPPINIKKEAKEAYFNTLDLYATKGDIKPFSQLVEDTMDKEVAKFLDMYKQHIKENPWKKQLAADKDQGRE